jgi:hypothetical protein
MTKKLLTGLALICALSTTACEPWWYHHHHDRGGYGYREHERRGPYIGAEGGYYR